MNLKAHPATIKPSRAGHSIGRWRTTCWSSRLSASPPGAVAADSQQRATARRRALSLDPEKMLLTRSYTAEDPVLKGQFTGSDVIGVADLSAKPDPCKELGFLDYSKAAKK